VSYEPSLAADSFAHSFFSAQTPTQSNVGHLVASYDEAPPSPVAATRPLHPHSAAMPLSPPMAYDADLTKKHDDAGRGCWGRFVASPFAVFGGLVALAVLLFAGGVVAAVFFVNDFNRVQKFIAGSCNITSVASGSNMACPRAFCVGAGALRGVRRL
jgi:hypothetical protein